MGNEERMAIVVDGGSSVRQEFPEVITREVVVVPLDLQFQGNDGRTTSYRGSEITADSFYERMRGSKVLPKTSGAISGRIMETFLELGARTHNIVSIAITSRHSAAWESAALGARLAQERNPDLKIRVIDSRSLSIATWFLAEQAADMAAAGASLDDVERVTLETIPKMETEVALDTMENIVKGGRAPALAGVLGSLLKIKPIIGVIDGEIKQISKPRTMTSARRELITRARGKNGKIERLAIVHTNDPNGAEVMADLVGEFYPREKVRIYEAGPVIGVHTGEGAMGIIIQRK